MITTLTDQNGTQLNIEKRPLDVLITIELRGGNAAYFYAKQEDMPELINTLCAYYDEPNDEAPHNGENRVEYTGNMQAKILK